MVQLRASKTRASTSSTSLPQPFSSWKQRYVPFSNILYKERKKNHQHRLKHNETGKGAKQRERNAGLVVSTVVCHERAHSSFDFIIFNNHDILRPLVVIYLLFLVVSTVCHEGAHSSFLIMLSIII